ncbi:MAG: histidine kinase [Bacteroidota bacterium]|nr:histidine kinase [Bacteroidota bacterium]
MKVFIKYFFFLFGLSAFAQSPSFNFQKLGSEDGLNNTNIFNIEQHQNGLVYFTTQNGIYFYDGYNFNKLSVDSLKSNALLNVSIKNVDELLFSIRDEGIANYNLKTKAYFFLPKLNIKTNADNFIITKNFAYLLTSGIKLTIVNLTSGEIKTDDFKKAEKPNRAYCIYKTSDEKILLGRTDGLYEITEGIQKKLDILKNTTVHAITQSSDKKLIIGTSNKIVVLNNLKLEKEIIPTYNTKTTTFMLGGEKSIDKLLVDNYGKIWFTSYPDENLYLYQNNTVYDVFEGLDIPPSLINCIYKDKSENIWVGTFNDGVYYIQNPFFNSINFLFQGKILNVNQAYLKNNLLVTATNNGLYGLNIKTNQTKTLSSPDAFLMEPINNITELNDVLYYSKRSQFDMAPSIFSDSKFVYKFKPIIAKQFLPISNNQSIIADWGANILLCNADGTKTLDTLISFPDYRISINAFLKQNDSLYIGTSNGLYIYDFKSHVHKNIVRSELNFKINDIALINNRLYIAHESGITEVYSNKLITEVGSLRLNSVKKIKHYNSQIWLATLDGVFVCDEKLEPIKILNKSTGLLSNSINDIVFNAESVCFCTARGVAISDIKDILGYNSTLNSVSINYVTVDGKIIETTNNVLNLTANQNDVSIYFYSPFYNKPNKQNYRYRQNNGEWKKIDNTSCNLFSLAGGKTNVEISASIDNITWSKPTLISINKEMGVTESQWIYWVFTIIGLLLVSGISYIIVRRVKYKATKRLQEEQQVHLLKHQAMNALLSPHFIFNSLTSIQNYINTNNSLRASEYLAKFSRLIRMIIEKASQSEISLTDELARLTYYLELEKERFKNKFDYEITVDDAIDKINTSIPNMIIQPHVENCIIHGILPKLSHGTLKISFKKNKLNKLIITIEDDGVGLIKAKEHAKTGHKSLGTSTIKNILEINSKLTGKNQVVTMVDKSTINTNTSGTIITIELEQ